MTNDQSNRIEPRKVGVIGCGNISGAYFQAARRFPILDIVACADIDPAAAARAAREWGVAALPVDALLGREDIEIILNLTTPQAHAEVTLAALRAGKHVHSEKPLAIDRASGQRILDAAARHKRRVSCAPDTFLGGGLQTCRKLIDDGWIGRPVAGTAFMMCHGHESWHPNPGFYYLAGGGPVFDMGPYYLTALVHLLGPVRRVSGSAVKTFAERVASSAARRGEHLPVEVPTHVAGTLDFRSGAVVSLVMSFDVWHHSNHPIEIHGEDGSLQVPDPNTFGGPVRLRRRADDHWQAMPLTHGYTDNVRGIGVADLAFALHSNRSHRCHSDLAFHVLEIMEALHESSARGEHILIDSVCERPEPLPRHLQGGDLGDGIEVNR